jgi:hypothetical protein
MNKCIIQQQLSQKYTQLSKCTSMGLKEWSNGNLHKTDENSCNIINVSNMITSTCKLITVLTC